MRSSEVSAWADSWNFRASVSFGDVRRSTLPADGPRRSGWYLLCFDDGSFYIGESVDLRSRMGGHAAEWGDEITMVRLLPKAASKQQLQVLERQLIREARERKIPLRNVTHSDVTIGRDALDEILCTDEQTRWLADPRTFNVQRPDPLKDLAEQEVRYTTAVRRYRELPESGALTALLRNFLEACVPSPRATEFQYWSVSTGTYGQSKYPRRFCVSVGMMEVFVAHGLRDTPGAILGILNVRESTLLSEFGTPHAFQKRHPGVRIEASEYVDAGDDLVTLRTSDLSTLERLLRDPGVSAAAAQLVIDLMRKHYCVYTRYHCPQLVQMDFDWPGKLDAGGRRTERACSIRASRSWRSAPLPRCLD
ncbi:GIY-YIG nuclease family protein [Rhodococcus phenolicus]|uniref:GIY-YIG nuclease family protein n=1 Tax=Rhodococcus phenolicus TaxID=263849 RepID=UPI0012E92792|nr:GIY-YIG nuclease family protein [Rhodococcus phenolicus]